MTYKGDPRITALFEDEGDFYKVETFKKVPQPRVEVIDCIRFDRPDSTLDDGKYIRMTTENGEDELLIMWLRFDYSINGLACISNEDFARRLEAEYNEEMDRISEVFKQVKQELDERNET